MSHYISLSETPLMREFFYHRIYENHRIGIHARMCSENPRLPAGHLGADLLRPTVPVTAHSLVTVTTLGQIAQLCGHWAD